MLKVYYLSVFAESKRSSFKSVLNLRKAICVCWISQSVHLSNVCWNKTFFFGKCVRLLVPVLDRRPLCHKEEANGDTQFSVNYYFFGQISVNYYFWANSQLTTNFGWLLTFTFLQRILFRHNLTFPSFSKSIAFGAGPTKIKV